MITRFFRRSLLLAAVLTVAALLILSWRAMTAEWSATIGITRDMVFLQENSKGYAFPDILKTEGQYTGSARSGGEYRGPVTLLVGDHRIDLPRGWLVYFVNAGHVTKFDLLELDGRYTLEEAVDQFMAYYDMLRAMPDWKQEHLFRFVEPEIDPSQYDSDDGVRSVLAEVLTEFRPDGRHGTRKLMVLMSRYRTIIDGHVYFPSFDINLTYDTDNPDHPYRFAFSIGLHARSMRCLEKLNQYFESKAKGESFSSPSYQRTKFPPDLLAAFEAWDTDDLSNATVLPMIKDYLSRCDLDVESWDEL